MSKLDDILNEPLDPVTYDLVRAKDETTMSGLGYDIKQQIKDLMLELIGGDEKVPPFNKYGNSDYWEAYGRNLAKVELRQKVEAL